jgi:hypothetical protein
MIALLSLSMAWASQWRELRDLPALAELAPRSQAVVVGTVQSVETLLAPWGLSTRYTLAVTDTLSGEAAERVVLELPGGRRDGLQQQFVGVPLWAPGDSVLVFLPREGQRPLLAGLFTVVEGERLLDPLGESALRPHTLEEVRSTLASTPLVR